MIKSEVMRAYSDYWGGTERNLRFRASMPVYKDEAISILNECLTDGYNSFEADNLSSLPDDARITIAREGSVCIYVEGRCKNIGADEHSYNPSTNETRMWWD